MELDTKSRGKYKYKKLNHPNEIDKFYASLTDKQRQRWAESYMTFIDYYNIHKK